MKSKLFSLFALPVVVLLSHSVSTSLYAQSMAQKIDSLERVVATHPPTGAELLRIYSDLSSYYTTNYNPQKNLEYSRKGIYLAKKLNNQYEVAFLYNNIGSAYDDLSQLDSTIIYYEMALRLIEEVENKNQESAKNISYLKGITYSNLGNMYNVQGLSDKAIEHYLKAITLYEEFGVWDRLAKVFRNISLVYTNINNYSQAEYYLSKGAEINNRLHDSLGLASTLTRMGHIYLKQLKYPQALQCVEDAEKIYANYVEKRDLRIYNLRVLSAIWSNGFRNEQKAMEFAVKALDESRKMGIKLEISRSLQTISCLQVEYKHYYQAEQTAMEALQTDSTNFTNNILLYEDLCLAHAGLGNITKAQDYFALYKAATIDYSNQNFQSSLSEMEVKYETEKKEMRITTLEAEKRLAMLLSMAGGVLLLLGLTALFFLWRWTVQKKRTAEQQHKLAQVCIKQLEQEKQLVATQSLLEGEANERSRLARDLHDGLGSMLTGAKMNLLELKKAIVLERKEVQQFDQAVGLLDKSVTEMRRVAHHLMPDTLTRFGLKSAVNDLCLSLPALVQFHYYGDESRLNAQIEVMIYSAILELVNNALKHAHAHNVAVQIVQESDRIAFNVQDDGCGFDPDILSSGMGLQNVRTRVAAFNGILHIDSSTGKGTEVNVEINLKA